MDLVFLGSGAIAVPVLRRLARHPDHRVCGVLSQPDRPAGRQRVLTPSPVTLAARELELEVLTPERVGDPAVRDWLTERRPELGVVFAYGQFIPRAVHDLPARRMINLHPSLLPLYRGAAPIAWAMAEGCTETGVSIQYVEPEMDGGDILAQLRVEIDPEEDAEALTARLVALGTEMLVELLAEMAAGRAQAVPQDRARATLARRLTKEDGRLDWSLPARQLRNRVRAFVPWPGSFFPFGPVEANASCKVRRARVEPGQAAPGTVLEWGGDGPLIATGEDALRLLVLQPPGGREMSGRDFVRGRPPPPENRLR
jgi:methionyl-tRNA formyltransferase